MKEIIARLIVKLKTARYSTQTLLEGVVRKSKIGRLYIENKRKFIGLLTFVLILAVLYLTLSADQFAKINKTLFNDSQKNKQNFLVAEALMLKNLDGQTSSYFQDFSKEKGESLKLKFRGYVVHFWASWCSPCLDELPLWVEAANKKENQVYRWIAVAREEDWKGAIKVIETSCDGMDCKGNIEFLLDSDGLAAERWGSFDYPETFIVSAKGQVVKKLIGPQEWGSLSLENEMKGE